MMVAQDDESQAIYPIFYLLKGDYTLNPKPYIPCILTMQAASISGLRGKLPPEHGSSAAHEESRVMK